MSGTMVHHENAPVKEPHPPAHHRIVKWRWELLWGASVSRESPRDMDQGI